MLKRYEREVKSIEPSNLRAIGEFLSAFCDKFEFEENKLKIEFYVPRLSSRTKNYKLIIAIGNGFYSPERKLRNGVSGKPFNNFYNLSMKGVLIAYCKITSAASVEYRQSTVSVIVQQFIRYMILRGFANSNHIYAFGSGEDRFGGYTAACVASCIPDCFAGLYVIDADASAALTPQLANMRVYVQLSRQIAESASGGDIKAFLNDALEKNGLFGDNDLAKGIVLSETPRFDARILNEMLGKARIAYPSKISLRIFDYSARYSFYYAEIDSKSLRGGETALIERKTPNEYQITSPSNLKFAILLNELAANVSESVIVKSGKGKTVIENPSTMKSAELLDHCLATKIDIAFAFSIRIYTTNFWNITVKNEI